jgi:hypothetical protein
LASETLISGCLDWTVGSRAGLEVMFDPLIGWKADLGMSPFGLITADAFCLFRFLSPDDPFRLNLLLGIPNMSVLYTFDAGMVSLGASIEGGYWFNHRVSMNMRIGAGYPFFFEKDSKVIRDIQFPFNLWPDFTVSITVRV